MIPPYQSPTRPVQRLPRNPLARRAGVLLIVLASGAMLIGLMALAFALLLPLVENDPAIADTLAQLRRQTTIGVRPLMTVTAIVFLAYAAGAATIGIGLLRGRRRWVIAGLVLSIAVGLIMVLNTLGAIFSGAGGLFPLILVALHGLAVYWLIPALDSSQELAPQRPQVFVPTTQPMPPAPPDVQPAALPAASTPPQPMQDYYLPLPPVSERR